MNPPGFFYSVDNNGEEKKLANGRGSNGEDGDFLLIFAYKGM